MINLTNKIDIPQEYIDQIDHGYWEWFIQQNDPLTYSDMIKFGFHDTSSGQVYVDIDATKFGFWNTVKDEIEKITGLTIIENSPSRTPGIPYIDIVKVSDGSAGMVPKDFVQTSLGKEGWNYVEINIDRNGFDQKDSLLHEMLHAFGLGHPGDYNGFAEEKEFHYDDSSLSAMSYFGDSDEITHNAMAADLMVLWDKIGGAPISMNDGDDVYRLNQWGYHNIVDTGGYDIVDLSGSVDDNVIDLRPGRLSDIGDHVGYSYQVAIMGQYSNFAGSYVEEVISGSGDDVLIGSEKDNFFTGGAGLNELHGNAGSDTAKYLQDNLSIEIGRLVASDDFVYVISSNPEFTSFDKLYEIETIQLGDSDDDVNVSWEGALYVTDDHTSRIAIKAGDGSDNLTGSRKSDALYGQEGDDVISGKEGDDLLYGGEGNDLFTSEKGDDLIDGGADFDIYALTVSPGSFHYEFIGHLGEVISGDVGAVVTGDQVRYSFEGDLYTDTFTNIERILGTIHTDVFDKLDVEEVFADRGDDFITLDDRLIKIDGGTDFDTLDLSNLSFGVRWDGIHNGQDRTTLASWDGVTVGEAYSVTNIEAYIGTSHDDWIDIRQGTTVFGGGGNDIIEGDGSAEFLHGDEGNDTIRGSGGDDYIEGGAGSDFLDGGSGSDTVSYHNSTNGIVVDLRKGSTQLDGYSDSSMDTLVSIENIIGSEYNDVLHTQDRSGNDYSSARGGSGNDVLYGHGYKSSIYGDSGDDVLYGKGHSGGMVGTSTNIYGGTGNDTVYANTDNGSTGTIRGDSGEDIIHAYRGRFNINGGADADFIHAGSYSYSKSSTVAGGSGADVFFLEDAVTVTDFSAGEDFIVFNQDGVTVPNFRQDGSDVVLTYYWDYGYRCEIRIKSISISELEGSYSVGTKSYALQKFEERRSSHIDGTETNDYLSGGIGADFLYGGNGNDVLTAEAGDDDLSGGLGNDTLYGGAGDDRLEGGRGSDSIAGGAGDDVFDFQIVNLGDSTFEGFGHDVITDFADTSSDQMSDTLKVGYQEMPEGTYHNFEIIGADTVLIFTYSEGETSSIRLKNYHMEEQDIQVSANGITVHGNTDRRISEEILVGTEGNDVIDAGIGNDSLTGLEGNDTLSGFDGDDYLRGGMGSDILDGGAGSDTLNGDAGDDTLIGLGGDDRLYGESGNDSLDGGEGIDSLYGDTGNDLISGGAGDDSINGGAGNDIMSGGAGNDAYKFYIGDRGDGTFDGFGHDVISDFADGATDQMIDRLEINYYGLPETVYQGFEIDGNDTVLTFVYGAGETSTIRLENYIMQEWDAWTSPDSMTIYGQTSNRVSHGILEGTEAGDTLDGGAGDDTLIGLGGDDRLYGEFGNDSLDGGDGADYLSGRAGNDTLSGGAGADTIYGGDGDDILAAGSGDDNIDGGAGNDTMSGGTGNDVYTFYIGDRGDGTFDGFGHDLISDFADGAAGQMIDRIEINYYGLPETTYQGFEIDGNDTVLIFAYGAGETSTIRLENYIMQEWDAWPSADSMTIYGRTSNRVSHDTLAGTEVNDTLDGGAGDDTLTGLGGDDRLYGESGNDHLDGGEGMDDLSGNDGNDTLLGGAGDDSIYGGAGNDTMTGGTGNDAYTFYIGDRGDGTFDGFGHDVISDFADGAADQMIDRLEINYYGLPETVYQGFEIDGNDTVLTFVYGASETSTIRLENYIMQEWDAWSSPDSMTIYGQTSNRVSHDILEGTEAGDTLDGGAGDDTLTGLGGDDRLYGDSGNDHLNGGEGMDDLSGNDGNDTLLGGAGDDSINGGAGNDTMSGGAGNDAYQFYIGDRGDGTFDGFGHDVISDFADGEAGQMIDRIEINYYGLPETIYQGFEVDGNDTILTFSYGAGETSTIRLENYIMQEWDAWPSPDSMTIYGRTSNRVSHDILEGTEAGDTLDGGAGDDTLTGLGGDDRLYGDSGNDHLNGGEGMDDLSGNDGNDTLLGGAGDDSINGGAGNDTMSGGAGNDVYKFYIGDRGDGTFDGFGHDVISDFADGAAGQMIDRIEINYYGLPETIYQGFEIDGNDTLLTFAYGAGETSTIRLENYIMEEWEAWPSADSMTIYGQASNRVSHDILEGTEASDTLYGGAGDDTLIGYGGDDDLSGDFGNDSLDGGEGADYLSGRAGNDTLSGGAGADTIYGGDGDDILNAGSGDDSLEGGRGDDVLSGGSGNDTFSFYIHDFGDGTYEGFGHDVISDFAYGASDQIVDRVEINHWGMSDTTYQGFEIDGNDTVLTFAYGAGEISTIRLENYLMEKWDVFSNNESTTIHGQDRNRFSHDVLIGTEGNDDLSGGAGNDTLTGLGGDDWLLGDAGDDSIDGGAGNDFIAGITGNDILTGGAGADVFHFLEDFGNDTIKDFEAGDQIEIMLWDISFEEMETTASDTLLNFSYTDPDTGEQTASSVMLENYLLDPANMVNDGYRILIEEAYF